MTDASMYRPARVVFRDLTPGTVGVLTGAQLRKVSGGHVGFFPFCGGFPKFRSHYGVYGVNRFFRCKLREGFHF